MQQTVLKTQATPQSTEFAQDVQDFFSGRRAGHLSRWLYSVPQFPGDKACGVDAWAKVAEEAKQGSPYYVFKDEEAVIAKATATVAHLFQDQTRLIDLGPGSVDALNNKIFPFIYAGQGKVSDYVAVDVSTKSLQMAQENVAAAFPDIKVKTLNQDFIQDRFAYGDARSCEVGLFFGLTLFNMPIDPRVKGLPEKMLTASLLRIKSHFTSPNSYLVVTQDTNQNIETLRAAYMTRKPVYMTLPHRIARDLNVQEGFDPDGFDLDIEFMPETQACAMCFIARHDMVFSVDGHDFALHRGQRLYFHNAFKFDQAFFTSAAERTGIQVLETVFESTNPCLLQVLKI
jgi:L-histidine Nalpha-methyltransferase